MDLNRLSSARLLLTLVSEQLLSDCCDRDSFALCFVHHGTGIVCSELTVLMLAAGDCREPSVLGSVLAPDAPRGLLVVS